MMRLTVRAARHVSRVHDDVSRVHDDVSRVHNDISRVHDDVSRVYVECRRNETPAIAGCNQVTATVMICPFTCT